MEESKNGAVNLSLDQNTRDNERILVNTEIEAHGKKAIIAYLLWFILGTVGGHRFYLGKTGSAVTMLILAVLGYLTAFIIIGFVFLAVVWVWTIIDVFLINGMIRDNHREIERSILDRRL